MSVSVNKLIDKINKKIVFHKKVEKHSKRIATAIFNPKKSDIDFDYLFNGDFDNGKKGIIEFVFETTKSNKKSKNICLKLAVILVTENENAKESLKNCNLNYEKSVKYLFNKEDADFILNLINFRQDCKKLVEFEFKKMTIRDEIISV
ncbi:hypothetical protein MHBO_001977 [Bonamia ostreae]|uniref:Uncharacterized protein n=1 Tax=Bonamia ostreae TaxID=126728 RepID=A0ABV2AKS4_9EUKA